MGMNRVTIRLLMFHKDGRIRHHCAEIPLIPLATRMNIGLSNTETITQEAISNLTSHTKDTTIWGHIPLDPEKSLQPSPLGTVPTMNEHLWRVIEVQGLVTFSLLRRRPQKINRVALLYPSTNAVTVGKDLPDPVV